jgi:transcriptional regulator with XRE-family HTH domain
MSKAQDALAYRVKELRKVEGLTQESLAAKAQLSIQHIGEIERGVGNPKFNSLEKLAEGLDVSLADLLDFEYAQIDDNQVDEVIAQLLSSQKAPQKRLVLRLLKALFK